MHRPGPHRLRRACAVPALLALLAACGGGASGDGAPASSETAASDQTGSSSGEASGATGDEQTGDEQSGDAPLDESTFTAALVEGMAGQDTAKFRMTMAAGGQSFDSTGKLRLGGKSQDVDLTMDGSAFGVENVRMMVVDQVAYMAMPPMTPPGKYIRIPVKGKNSPFGAMGGQFGPAPEKTFKAFDKGLRDVTYVGEEASDGEQLDHYELTVDYRAAAKAQGMPRVPGAPKQVTYDIWLDDTHLMRRLEMDLMQATVDMEMFDWGEPVRIRKPRPADVVDAPPALGGPAGS